MSLAIIVALLAAAAPAAAPVAVPPGASGIHSVPFTQVRVEDDFWSPLLAVNRTVTIPTCLRKCIETGRVRNFARAAGRDPTAFQGIFFDDSDVYKAIEAASYSLATHPDPALETQLDGIIEQIAAAQEPDGYLYTIARCEKRAPDRRWKDEQSSHELYNAGHLYEAAVAHFQATGKRTLLDVAVRNADLVAATFGPTGRHEVPGHEEIELALVRLAAAANKPQYVTLARYFIDERGNAAGHKLYGDYAQDHLPFAQQREAVGHAVRAGYLYAGAADVAAATGTHDYDAALDAIWLDIAARKLAISGGMGSFAQNEGFGAAYDLPNESAYLETCAAIANCLFQQRQYWRTGSSAPIDLYERALYNAVLPGVSMAGDTFFYPNPMACDGARKFNHGTLGRSPWFGCSCCPVNIVRFLAALPGAIYGTRPGRVDINLYIGSEVRVEVAGCLVTLKLRMYQSTQRAVLEVISVDTKAATAATAAATAAAPTPTFDIAFREPAWSMADRELTPGGLYHRDPAASEGAFNVETGSPATTRRDGGYTVLNRAWQPGDRIDIHMDASPFRVLADERIAADRGRVAVQCGPVMYCMEAADQRVNGAPVQRVANLVLQDDSVVQTSLERNLLGGTMVVNADGVALERGADGSITAAPAVFALVPYHLWANRTVGAMTMWPARTREAATVEPLPTLASRSKASASHCYETDTVEALHDRVAPATSGDQCIPRFTWWPHKGTTEWVEYDLPAPTEVRGARVYFFDDSGGCRLPRAWRLLYRAADGWHPAAGTADAPALNRMTQVRLNAPVVTDALRLECDLQPDASAGILEWEVDGPTP